MDDGWMDATPECSGEPGRVQTDDTVFSQLRRLLTRHEIGGKRLQNKALVILFSAAFSGLICQTPGFFLHALSFFLYFYFFKKCSPPPPPHFSFEALLSSPRQRMLFVSIFLSGCMDFFGKNFPHVWVFFVLCFTFLFSCFLFFF